MKVEEALKTVVAGGVAGCCAKTAVAPFDRVKILLQAHNRHYKHLGVFSTVKKVIHKEGVLALYKANGIQMIRIFPYAAIQYSSYEQYKSLIRTLNVSSNVCKLFAGSLAGLTSVVVTYPLDMIRARFAFQVKGEHVYFSFIHTFKSILHLEGGVKGLYRGLVPSIIGMAPYAGLSFFTFETLKNFFLDNFPHELGAPCPRNTGGVVLIIPAKLICGGFAGAVAQTVSYPLDVVRRRLQVSIMLPDAHKYSSNWMQVLYMVYKEDGVRHGLYRGLSVNYLRVIPMVAVSFTTYETIKSMFGLDTGVDR